MKDPLTRTGVRFAARSLRAKVALGVALPLVIALSGFSYAHFLRERSLLADQLRATAAQLGAVMAGGLRHAMLANDSSTMKEILDDIAGMEVIDRVRIVDAQGIVRHDSTGEDVGRADSRSAPGCSECHAQPPAERPHAVLLSAAQGTLRIATPIRNEAACDGCHRPGPAHLGVLLADVPLQTLEAGLVTDLTWSLVASVGVAVAIGLGVMLLVQGLIVRRLEAMQVPLARYAGGDFTVRLPSATLPGDEINNLASAFNDMAEHLERTALAERQQRELRERAAFEERERIARELHDGLAQILAYVSTKAMAIRLLLTNRQGAAAQQQLQQLEEAAREVLLDLRQAILGLRLTSRPGGSLPDRLRDYAGQFSRLSGVPVHVEISAEDAATELGPAAEVELLRIVQEALTNIRKHAAAHTAWIRLEKVDGAVQLSVTDDGEGFDPGGRRDQDPDHFGLESMRQRARVIGAELNVESTRGAGTRVTVRLRERES